jgi:hypothetical protein
MDLIPALTPRLTAADVSQTVSRRNAPGAKRFARTRQAAPASDIPIEIKWLTSLADWHGRCS